MAATLPLHTRTWAGLSLSEKQILSPLAELWDKLPAPQRRKWGKIAKLYPSMSPDAQGRIQSNMIEWSRLTPEERAHARKNFAKMQRKSELSKHEMLRRWEAYQQLPEPEKDFLAKTNTKNKSITQKPSSTRSTASRTLPTPVLQVDSVTALLERNKFPFRAQEK